MSAGYGNIATMASYGRDQVYNRYPNGGYGYPGNGYGYPWRLRLSRNGGYGYPNGGYGYPGNGGYGRGGYGNGSASGAGYRQGMQDGSYQARKDISQNKPFNPNPRGASHSDHGYNSSMGDKHCLPSLIRSGLSVRLSGELWRRPGRQSRMGVLETAISN